MVNGNFGHGLSRMEISAELGYPIASNPWAGALELRTTVVFNFVDPDVWQEFPIGWIRDLRPGWALVEWDLGRLPTRWVECSALKSVKVTD
jgi:hypothetical protein